MRSRKAAGQHPAELDSFLLELAKLLIDSGVLLPRFQTSVEAAFIKAAASRARFSNRKVNQSLLAAMTGLNRLRVRSAIRADRLNPNGGDRIERIVSMWRKGEGFQTGKGIPRVLALKGKSGSFEALARSQGGDIPGRALLREMQRLGLVVVTARSVRLESNQRRSPGAQGIQRLNAALAAALAPPLSNARTSIDARSMHFQFKALSNKGRAVLRQRIVQEMNAFSTDLQSAIDSTASFGARKTNRAGKMSKLAVLLISHE